MPKGCDSIGCMNDAQVHIENVKPNADEPRDMFLCGYHAVTQALTWSKSQVAFDYHPMRSLGCNICRG